MEQGQRILLAGAGGGFDIFCGLPLYFALRDAGKEVYLGNLSFSALAAGLGRPLADAVVEVRADSPGSSHYFPERELSRWFRTQGEEVPIFCFERTGVRPLVDAYHALVAHLNLDTIILVDGGTDSLMRGDEVGLGTPQEDIASIAAVDEVEVPRKALVCLGFGIDQYHGVCHAQFLEAVANLSQSGGLLGIFSLMEEMSPVQRYRAATEAVFKAMPHEVSIVSSSILSALAGHYGNYHATRRTSGSKLWINPLMTLYWCFRLTPVAQRILYLDEMKATTTYEEVRSVIRLFRQRTPARPWEAIPV